MERSELRKIPERVGGLGLTTAAIALTFGVPIAIYLADLAIAPELQQITLPWSALASSGAAVVTGVGAAAAGFAIGRSERRKK